MKKILVTTMILVFAFAMSNAQDYSTGIGLRGGVASGLTVKHFLGETNAIEGILDIGENGFNITGLYEFHNPLSQAGLHWYYGFGAHLGFYDGAQSYMGIGVDGIIGLEYNFTDLPINLSLDWKPALNVVGDSDFHPTGGGLSIRYIF